MPVIIQPSDDWAESVAEYAVEALTQRLPGETLAEMWQRRIFPAWYPVRAAFLGRVRAFDQGRKPPVPDALPDGLITLGCEVNAAAWTYIRIQKGDLQDMPGPVARRVRQMMQEGPLS